MNSSQQRADGKEAMVNGESVRASLERIAVQLEKYAAMVGTGQMISIRCYDLRMLAQTVRDDGERVGRMVNAGQAVVNRWEQGDLARVATEGDE